MTFLAVPLWAHFDASGWDLDVYHAAIRSLHAGHDPYVDAMGRQIAYHNQLALHPDLLSAPPYLYVYFPITLPLLRFLGTLPAWFSGTGYWLVYGLGAFAVVWAGMQAVEQQERSAFAFFAPVAVFFPALLENGVILSGNVAYLVYGAVLAAAVVGWRLGRWRWFYLIVLAASCIKPQLVTLLALPVLSARKQWVSAGLTAGAVLLLFVMQAVVWPVLFLHCMQAIKLQIGQSRDFGSSPSGTLAGYLFDHGLNYSRGSGLLYVLYAAALCCFLFFLSRRFLAGSFPLTRWIPVLLPGVLLLNPRIQEYDLAILTLPLALIVWRLLPGLPDNRIVLTSLAIAFALVNVAASRSWILWKEIACCVVVLLFFAGAWQLLRGDRSRCADGAVGA